MRNQPAWLQQALETAERVREEDKAAETKESERRHRVWDKRDREIADRIIRDIRPEIEKAARSGEKSTLVFVVTYREPPGDIPNFNTSVQGLVEKYCKEELGLRTWWHFVQERHMPGHELEPSRRELHVDL